jgi:hypothetical protein
MSWRHLGRFGSQDDIVTTVNKFNLGPGGLVFCLANRNQYSAWVNDEAKPGSGKWGHFAVATDAEVVRELNRMGVAQGNATVAVYGDNSAYVVLYYV